MKDNKTSIIIKEYYTVISPLLAFAPCERIGEIEQQVLRLLCESKGCAELAEECLALVDSAKCVQTYADGALLHSADMAQQNIAYDIKLDILTACKIGKVCQFSEGIFAEDLKNSANVGQRNACKLLAFLSWLGMVVPENKSAAQNIWLSLAMSGDWQAVEMLIYGYGNTGDETERKKWSHIQDILKRQMEAFSAIALYSDYAEYTEEEVQTANLIMFISQKSDRGATYINRPMLQYALYSTDDYAAKMVRLSSETNYYLVMHNEDRFANKTYGF